MSMITQVRDLHGLAERLRRPESDSRAVVGIVDRRGHEYRDSAYGLLPQIRGKNL